MPTLKVQFDVTPAFARLVQSIVTRDTAQQEEIMAGFAEVQVALDGVATSLSAAMTRIQADVTALLAQVDANSQAAASLTQLQADLDTAVVAADQMKATLDSIDPVPGN